MRARGGSFHFIFVVVCVIGVEHLGVLMSRARTESSAMVVVCCISRATRSGGSPVLVLREGRYSLLTNFGGIVWLSNF